MSQQAFQELDIEHFADGDSDVTLGWLVRYADGFAIWCGELSRAAFASQSAAVRHGLRDDLGWYLVEIDLRSDPAGASKVLARVACEGDGLDLATAIALGRQVQRARS